MTTKGLVQECSQQLYSWLPEVENSQMSINRSMNKQVVVSSYSRRYLAFKGRELFISSTTWMTLKTHIEQKTQDTREDTV